MTKLIEGYSQHLPTIILSSEHRGYNNEEIVQLVDTFAQFVFRRVVYYQVSEEKFAENLQQLAVFVNCGFIIVIMGAEYLKGAQQYELIQLSKNIRSKDADYIGLLTPYIDQQICESNQSKGEHYIPLGFRNSKTGDFRDQGMLIFFVPQLASTITADKFIHVPTTSVGDGQMNMSGHFSKEYSQSFQIESSTRESSSAEETSQSTSSAEFRNSRRTGTNNYS